jgi:hypothetical protein
MANIQIFVAFDAIADGFLTNLCQYIFRTFSTLGSGPVNVLIRYLDIACLTVDAAK